MATSSSSSSTTTLEAAGRLDALRAWRRCAAAAVALLALASPGAVAEPGSGHSAEEVAAFAKAFTGRVTRKFYVVWVEEVLSVQQLEGGTWRVLLEGSFSFQHLGTASSGSFACLFLSDDDLRPTKMSMFRSERPTPEQWKKCGGQEDAP